MKHLHGFSLGILTFLAGCGQTATKEAPSFLPGIYVNQSENEFCRIVDTFIIRRTSLDGEGYQVSRKSSFQRIRHGEKLPLEYQAEQWYAVFEVQGRVLRGGEKGKELLYVPGENRVYNGNEGYEKVE